MKYNTEYFALLMESEIDQTIRLSAIKSLR